MNERTGGRTPRDNSGDHRGQEPGDDLAGWALDALDPAERARVEQQLADSSSTRARAESLREVATTLADAVAVRPPDHVRANILAALAHTPQETVLPVESAPEAAVPPVVAGADPWDRGATVSDLDRARTRRDERGVERQERRRRAARGWRALAAACVVAAVAGTGFAVDARRDAADARAEVARLSALSTQNEQLQQRMEEVLSAPDARTVHAEAADGGEATLLLGAAHAVVVTAGFPALTDREYQLWLVDGDQVSSAGTMGGATNAMFWVEDTGAAKAVAISVEPVGGSPAPTTAPILLTEV